MFNYAKYYKTHLVAVEKYIISKNGLCSYCFNTHFTWINSSVYYYT